VGVVYGEPPNRVRRVLVDAALEVAGVLPAPEPFAVVLRFDNFAVVYRLTFWIQDFARLPEIEGEVLAHIWYAFRRHGIQIPFPTSTVYTRPWIEADTEQRQHATERVAALLKGIDFLGALTQEEIERLAGQIQIAPFPAATVVVRQGEAGDSLFVVVSGRVRVTVTSLDGGPERLLAIIGVGDYFGELSLLTGAPRSATVRALDDTELLILTREALRPILLSDPATAGRLSETLAKRKGEHEDLAQQEAAAETPGSATDLPGYLLGRIRRFFGLSEES
ncbi:MAG: cyclic nucleotide-binding domain-containing protein, partial [Candidatus Rokuibacteriota bacterium]